MFVPGSCLEKDFSSRAQERIRARYCTSARGTGEPGSSASSALDLTLILNCNLQTDDRCSHIGYVVAYLGTRCMAWVNLDHFGQV